MNRRVCSRRYQHRHGWKGNLQVSGENCYSPPVNLADVQQGNCAEQTGRAGSDCTPNRASQPRALPCPTTVRQSHRSLYLGALRQPWAKRTGNAGITLKMKLLLHGRDLRKPSAVSGESPQMGEGPTKDDTRCSSVLRPSLSRDCRGPLPCVCPSILLGHGNGYQDSPCIFSYQIC